MAQPSPSMLKTIRIIDSISDWSGKIVQLMVLPLVFGLTYEVIARYGFNAPTEWAFDTTYMLYGSHFMLGAAYALLKGAHVRTDFFYERWPVKRQAMIDTIGYLFFFFPGLLFFLIAGTDAAIDSWWLMERSEQTPWRPLLAPFKTAIPVACLLLLIQGVSEFLKSLHAWRTGEKL
jgi:TRAP-type mannitol/chloroaromatic compound transport system permease small subunit